MSPEQIDSFKLSKGYNTGVSMEDWVLRLPLAWVEAIQWETQVTSFSFYRFNHKGSNLLMLRTERCLKMRDFSY